MWCGMSANREDDHLVFTQKSFSGVYLFFYAAGENVVGLIHTTPDIVDIPEYYIPDENVVDNMGDGMMQAMELINGNLCGDSYYRYEGGVYWMMTLTL